MPCALVFHRAFMLGRYSLPAIVTANHDAAPSPFSRPMLWLVRSPVANTLAPIGSFSGSAMSLAVSARRQPSGNSTRVYPVAPAPPMDLSTNNRLYEVLA